MKKLLLTLFILQTGCTFDDLYKGDSTQIENERTCSRYGFTYGTTAFSKCMMNLDKPKPQQNVIIHNNSNDRYRDELAHQNRLREMRLQNERDNIERERLRNENQRYQQDQMRTHNERRAAELRKQQEDIFKHQHANHAQEAEMRRQREQAARDQQAYRAQEEATRHQREQADRIKAQRAQEDAMSQQLEQIHRQREQEDRIKAQRAQESEMRERMEQINRQREQEKAAQEARAEQQKREAYERSQRTWDPTSGQ